MDLLIISTEKLKAVILSHKVELSMRKGSTEMLDLANRISKSIKQKNKIEDHFHHLLKDLSSNLSEFTTPDYVSLDSFVEHSNLINRETCFEYLALVENEKDDNKKYLLLKIANRMDEGYIPEKMILKYNEIKSIKPIFWLDILFKSNRKTAIAHLTEIVFQNNLTFLELFPILNRWLNLINREDELFTYFRDTVLDLEKCFTKKDFVLYTKWIEKRELKSEVIKGLENFQKKLIPLTKI